MKSKLPLCLALVLSIQLAGCVTGGQFRGTAANLNSNGELTSASSGLKMNVACSGITTNGGNYIVLSLPEQNCRLILFYPTMKQHQSLLMEIGTNHNHTWRFEDQFYCSSPGMEVPCNLNLPAAWLARGSRLDCSRLVRGLEASLPAKAGRMHGLVEINCANRPEFSAAVDLSDDTGQTKLCGNFDSHKELWSPLVSPTVATMLIFGAHGAEGSAPRRTETKEEGNDKSPAKIKISVHGNVNHPGDYTVSEFTTIDRAIEIAGGRAHPSDKLHVRRTENGKEELWTMDLSDQFHGFDLGRFFILIQGDDIELGGV